MAEWIFPAETHWWKAGLQELVAMEQHAATMDMDTVTLLTEHLFLTEQLGWRKGLNASQERGKKAIQKELQQIYNMDGFQPKHWFELTQEDSATHVSKGEERREPNRKGMC